MGKLKRMNQLEYHFGIKLRFYPSDKQKRIIKHNYDAQRFVYNQYVGINRLAYQVHATSRIKQLNGPLPFVMGQMNAFETAQVNNMLELKSSIATPKALRDKFAFLRVKDIDSLSLANAVQNYNKAWKNYRKLGHGTPTFHKKRNDWSYQTNCQYVKQNQAYLDNGTVRFIDLKHIKVPKLGTVRISGLRKLLKERIKKRIPTRIGTVTIKKTADNQFYLSMQLASDTQFVKSKAKTGKQLGIDLNLDNFLTDSNGAVVANPRFYRKNKLKLARLQRILSRRQRRAKSEGRALRDSKNYQKQTQKVASLQAKIRRQRQNFLHVLSTALIKSQDLVVAEELRSKNMIKNHALALSITDVGWRAFLSMLEYKAVLYGKQFVTIDPKYTTQRCSNCGTIMGQNGYHKLTLKDREWACPVCHAAHIRDWNAAKNILEKYQGAW
ncbi:MAG: RNA-guided endonuclease InsQ/TnpB family protein [Lactobacillus sp.]